MQVANRHDFMNQPLAVVERQKNNVGSGKKVSENRAHSWGMNA